MKNYKLAIVGATGVVGRTALKVLEEKIYQLVNMFYLPQINLPAKKLNL